MDGEKGEPTDHNFITSDVDEEELRQRFFPFVFFPSLSLVSSRYRNLSIAREAISVTTFRVQF